MVVLSVGVWCCSRSWSRYAEGHRGPAEVGEHGAVESLEPAPFRRREVGRQGEGGDFVQGVLEADERFGEHRGPGRDGGRPDERRELAGRIVEETLA
jgi:hypothetical protein